MIDYDALEHHPLSEKIVRVMQDRAQSDSALFFRLMVANYFAMAAASMHTHIMMPEGNKVPVNMYSLNLAPSNFGKTRSCRIMTKEVLNQFIPRFCEETFPILAEDNLPKLANSRAVRKGHDPDDELVAVQREFERTGELLFCFDSGTAPGAKQLRHKLLMANAGALNLIVDEVGLHLGKNTELVELFMELYDGEVGTTLNKNTQDNPRHAELRGTTPSNMILFGTSNKLLDGGKQEEDLLQLLESGYARRCFFGFVERNGQTTVDDPQKYLEMAKRAGASSDLQEISDRLANLADLINANKTLILPDDTALELYAYKLDCERRAASFKLVEEVRRTETISRFFKTIKLAGAYAFIDDSPEITKAHLHAAIKVAEESGKAFELLLKRDKPYVKLAKYVAELGDEVTHADLVEDLAFYPKSANQRNDMLTLAVAWGYKNNIIIKKSFQDGIEFLRGESLKETDLSQMVVSYSDDMTEGYRNEYAPFDQLHKLTQAPGMHWINHHLNGGYRNEDNAIPGFNMVVIDVDGGISLDMAKNLLKDYKALYYTTKRHTDTEHRFRIILPINYQLEMDYQEYKEFFGNLLEWLPFEADDSCKYRCKKWLTHPGHYEYTDGQLLDVLPFIPKTSKNEEHKKGMQALGNLDNLERWVMNNIGDGNRNNQLLRYAYILVDSGMGFDEVRSKVFSLNSKIADKLDEAEILNTIMVTVAKAIHKRHAQP